MDLRDLIKELEPISEKIKDSIKDLGWEKKALLTLGVIVLIIIVYAFNPFGSSPEIDVQNGTEYTPLSTPQPAPVISNNSSSNNTTSVILTNGSNGTFQISADQAKQIALNSNPGFTAGVPTQGTLTINNNAVSVWRVPLMKDSTLAREIYVNSETGIIVGTKII